MKEEIERLEEEIKNLNKELESLGEDVFDLEHEVDELQEEVNEYELTQSVDDEYQLPIENQNDELKIAVLKEHWSKTTLADIDKMVSGL